MVSKLRAQRIADRIHEILSEMIILEVKDPRLSGIFVTGVEVDRELTFADIYVSALEGTQRAKEVIAGLEHASGYLRTELTRRIDLRTFPKLRFHWDKTPEHADRIERLIASIQSDLTKKSNIGENEQTDELDNQ